MQRAVNPVKVAEERYEELIAAEKEALDYRAATRAFRDRTWHVVKQRGDCEFVQGWTAASMAMAEEITRAMDKRELEEEEGLR